MVRPLQEDEFSVRFTDKDLEGWLTKRDVVPEGSLDLLFLDGKYQDMLGPGAHDLGKSFPGFGGPRREVVRLRAGELTLEFAFDVRSADRYQVDAGANIVLQFQRTGAKLFHDNLLQDRERLTLVDLRLLVGPALRDSASGWFCQWNMETLEANPNSDDLARTLRQAATQVLAGKGVDVVKVLPRKPSSREWDRRADAAAEGPAETARLEDELALTTKRAELWDRLGRAINAAEMSRLRTDRELADFLRDMDKDKLLKEDDFERFKRTLAADREDGEGARRHLVRVAEMERDYEYRILDIRNQAKVVGAESELLTAEQELERLRLEHKRLIEQVAKPPPAPHPPTPPPMSDTEEIVNANDVMRTITRPLAEIRVVNCNDANIRLKEYVERIKVVNSNDVRVFAEKGYGTVEDRNNNGLRIM